MKCPACGVVVEASEPGDDPKTRYFPFCSKRCKMVDLGHWFDESYRVSRPVDGGDLPDTVEDI